jgi:DNA-binding transcriptional MerR regulator
LTSAPDVSPNLTESDRLYGISELASELGITARAIRFYEAKGLLTPPRANGGRVYTRRERARLKLILRAKSIGFSLAEVKQFLTLYGNRGEGRPQQVAFVAERSNTLIKELEQKQADVAATLQELKDIHWQCLRYLAEQGVPFTQADVISRREPTPKKHTTGRSKD